PSQHDGLADARHPGRAPARRGPPDPGRGRRRLLDRRPDRPALRGACVRDLLERREDRAGQGAWRHRRRQLREGRLDEDGAGVDVVPDTSGVATWAGSIRSLASGGRLVTCGATSGPMVETDVRIVFWKQLKIIGSTMANRTEFWHVMGQLFAGRLAAIVDRVVPLAEVRPALTPPHKAGPVREGV